MCKSGELTRIASEQLRNKRIFNILPYCIFILTLAAISINKLTNYFKNPPLKVTSEMI